MAFTDVATEQHYNKLGLKALCEAIDTNFALLEAGGAGAVTVDSLVCTAGATFGGGAAATGVTISTDGIVTMGAQGTGVTIASATPFGLEVHSQHASDVVAGATGLSCGIRSRYEISVAQTTLASLVAIEGRLRVKAALADGNHAGVMGTIESDDSIAFTGTSTTQRSAGAFAIELGASCTLSAGFLCGIAIDSSVNGNVDMSNVEFCGIRIKTSSSKEIWEHGLYIDDGGAVTGITLGTCTTGISIGVCANAIAIGGANTGHAIDISSTWGTGITGAAIAIGDYSNAIAFGTISEHLIGQVINVSAAVDDDSNIIPMHVAFANTADCGANSVAQVMYARATLAYAITDCYSVRARLDITDATTPTLNMVTGVFSTLTTKACNIDTTGNIAAFIGTVDGTEDITTAGYGKLSGVYINWNQTNALTADTCGMYIGIQSGATLDSGYRVNASGSLTNSFHSMNTSSTPTNALKIEGAHTNAFAFPVAGTAPTVAAAVGSGGGTTEGYVVVTIGGVAKKMYYWA